MMRGASTSSVTQSIFQQMLLRWKIKLPINGLVTALECRLVCVILPEPLQDCEQEVNVISHEVWFSVKTE